MTTWPQYALIAVFAVVVGGYLAFTMLGNRQDRGKWAISLTMMAGAAGFALHVPSLYRAVDHQIGVPNAATLLGALCYLAVGVLLHVWIAASWPGHYDRRRTLFVIGVTVPAAGALVVLFAVGSHPAEVPGDFSTLVTVYSNPATYAFTVVYLVVFTAYWPLAVIACRVVIADMKEAEQRRQRFSTAMGEEELEGDALLHWLQYGVRLVEIGMWLGLFYALLDVGIVTAMLTGHDRLVHWLVPLGNLAALASASNSTGGVTCGMWGPSVDQRRRPLREAEAEAAAQDRYDALSGLWQLIARQVRSNPVPTGLDPSRVPVTIAAGYLQIMLVDGYRDLAAYADVQVAEQVEELARRLGFHRRQRRALAEAAVLRAAARFKAQGVRPARRYTEMPVFEDHLETEAHLLAVAEAAQQFDKEGRIIADHRRLARAARRTRSILPAAGLRRPFALPDACRPDPHHRPSPALRRIEEPAS
jgi:hypothetical protein